MAHASNLQANIFANLAQLFKGITETVKQFKPKLSKASYEIPYNFTAATKKGKKILSSLPQVEATTKEKRIAAIKACSDAYIELVECNSGMVTGGFLVERSLQREHTNEILQKIENLMQAHGIQYLTENTKDEIELTRSTVRDYFNFVKAYHGYFNL